MLAPLLELALERAGRLRPVASGQGVASALRLETEIVVLQQEFDTQPSRLRFRLRAQLLDPAAGRVLATTELEALEPAESDDPYGGVVAANRAVARGAGGAGGVVRCAGAAGARRTLNGWRAPRAGDRNLDLEQLARRRRIVRIDDDEGDVVPLRIQTDALGLAPARPTVRLDERNQRFDLRVERRATGSPARSRRPRRRRSRWATLRPPRGRAGAPHRRDRRR